APSQPLGQTSTEPSPVPAAATLSSVTQDVSSGAGSTDDAVRMPPDAGPVATHEGREVDADEVDADEADADEDADTFARREGRQAQRRPLEGDRAFFGDELWGASERQRTAVSDTEKLGQIGLPLLTTERDLANWLGISLSRLRWYTHD